MIRIIAKLFAVTVALTAFLPVAPLFAAPVTYLATNGSGTSCTFSQPCANLFNALSATDDHGQITCFDSATFSNLGDQFSQNVTIDCPGVMVTGNGAFPALGLTGTNQVVKIRNLTFNGTSGGAVAIIKVFGSVTATFDGVTITNNAGGLRTDTTNGAVRVDISNSTINNNANNGVIAIGGAGGQNVMNLSRDVIASNGQVGIEVSGTTAGAIVDTTLLDSNTLGALSAVSSGRILTYQNNRIVGSPGTGFTGTASPN